MIYVLGWDVFWTKALLGRLECYMSKRFSLLLFCFPGHEPSACNSSRIIYRQIQGKKNYMTFQRDSSMSVILCKQITPNAVQSSSLHLHFEVIAAAKKLSLLRKEMSYFAASKKTMHQYKLYCN